METWVEEAPLLREMEMGFGERGERQKRERRLYEASLRGSVKSLKELIKEDGLILVRVPVTSFKDRPLHIAAMLGHVDFAKELLSHNSNLANELDTEGHSPLHLASANGHIEIVKMLLRVNIDVSRIRDKDERTPLYLAVMRGQVEVIKELIEANPDVTRFIVNQGETLLVTCVKCTRLEALKLVVQTGRVADFVNARDEDGYTILHLATFLKQLQTVKYLLTLSGLEVNKLNGNGLTALDIIVQMPRDFTSIEIREALQEVGVVKAIDMISSSTTHNTHNQNITEDKKISMAPSADGGKDINVTEAQPATSSPSNNTSSVNQQLMVKKKKEEWSKRNCDALLISATVFAAMAYQVGLNPPGGFWGDDMFTLSTLAPATVPIDQFKREHIAGHSIMADNYPSEYKKFWAYNTISFVACLSIIFVIVSGIPLKRRIIVWILMVAMWGTITFMALAYLIHMEAITPGPLWHSIIKIIVITTYSWLGLIGIVFIVHTFRFLKWIIRKVGKRRKMRLSRVNNIMNQTINV